MSHYIAYRNEQLRQHLLSYIFQREKFNRKYQSDDESVDEYIDCLRSLAASCGYDKYPGLKEELIRDRLVVGLRDPHLRQLLQLDDIDLNTAIEIIRKNEEARDTFLPSDCVDVLVKEEPSDGEQGNENNGNEVSLGVAPYQVAVCDESNERDVKIRKYREREKRHSCGLCHLKFSNKKFLSDHLLIHVKEELSGKVHQSQEKEGEICEDVADEDLLSWTDTENKTRKRQNRHCCDVCNLKFTNKKNLRRHTVTHKEPNKSTTSEALSCEQCSKTYTKYASYKMHLKIHAGKKYTCEFCSRQFVFKCDLKNHFRIHTGERPYSCEVCQKSFAVSNGLKKHMVSHTGEKRFSCEYCGKLFSSMTSLKKHIRIHTGEKPFECTICLKRFTQKSALNSHIFTHGIEKPFPCDVCGRRYANRGELKRHMLLHDPGVKFTCHICQKNFQFKSNLTKHVLVRHSLAEKSFACETCDKRFWTKGELHQHTLTHTGQRPRPYNCQFCTKAFHTMSHMKRHMLLHTGEKPFSCTICEKRFTQLTSLKWHLNSSHKGEQIP